MVDSHAQERVEGPHQKRKTDKTQKIGQATYFKRVNA